MYKSQIDLEYKASQVDLEYKASQLYISLIPARSLSGRIPDAKTGPKISK